MKTHTLGLALSLGAVLWTVTGVAQAQAPTTQQMLYVKSLAATCANCHGTDGKAVEGSQVVSLAGLDKNYLVTQMKAFKAGTRPATVMHQISKGYSDSQIDTVATYFAAQKK
ncbi:MAG: c-type cytochrome [Polaromonas sp.]|jgi:sulfide dehydrogenase cytochrome subunit|nr:c-type cytochrome [Polaromonas sp.]